MTSIQDNDTLTRVGRGTPMGDFMRQFWIPAAMSSELVSDGDPMRLMLLGEQLIAFRDTSGRVGIMDHRCPHRCASLFFGRNEEGGIRCVYHGWKYDTEGHCLEMPNVPPHQDFRDKVWAKAYKTAERNGLVWVYMGIQEEAPPLPEIEATLVPEDQLDMRMVQRECNWLQGVEGEMDTSHIGFLHFGHAQRKDFQKRDDEGYALTNRAPEYVSRETDYGYMYAAYRPAEGGDTYWRFAHFLFPFWTMPPINPIDRNVLCRAYVPMDDTHTMVVILAKKGSYAKSVSIRPDGIPGVSQNFPYEPNTTDWYGRWRLAANQSNDYMIDREVQRTKSFTGIEGVQLQDQAIQESMGAIVDRTLENLAPSDIMIARIRRVLLEAASLLARQGTLPRSAREPGACASVRGGHFVAAEDEDWLDAYAKRIADAPLEIAATQAAE